MLADGWRLGIVDDLRHKRETYARFINRRPPVISAPKPKPKVVAAPPKPPVEPPELPGRPSLQHIMDTVTEITGISAADLLSPCRSPRLAWPRHLMYWLTRQVRRDLSLPAIGRAYKRDHTSIIHGIRHIDAKREEEPFAGWLANPLAQNLLASGKPAKVIEPPRDNHRKAALLKEGRYLCRARRRANLYLDADVFRRVHEMAVEAEVGLSTCLRGLINKGLDSEPL